MLQSRPALWLIVIATTGNVLGAIVNYYFGLWGSQTILKKWYRLTDNDLQKIELRFQRLGTTGLLLAWVPIIGDPLTIAAGMVRVNIWIFLLFIILGKCARYTALALVF